MIAKNNNLIEIAVKTRESNAGNARLYWNDEERRKTSLSRTSKNKIYYCSRTDVQDASAQYVRVCLNEFSLQLHKHLNLQ